MPIRKVVTAFIKSFYGMLPAWVTSMHVEVLPAQTYLYDLPTNFDHLPAHFAKQYVRQLTISSKKIFLLSNVFATWQGMVFKNMRIFIPSLQTPELENYFVEPVLLKQWSATAIHLTQEEGVAIAHSQYAPENYYHWILDTLPRLLLLRQHYPGIAVIVLEPANDFVKVTLAALGFDNIVPVNKKQLLRINKLILPELLSPSGHVNPIQVRLVRDELINKLGTQITTTTAAPSRKVYISRARQQRRKVANQSELDELLLSHNFETIYFEELSLSQQIAVMQETAVLLSMHGANIVNLIFLGPTAKVIELVSEKLHNPAYWRLSAVFSLPYYVLPCKTVQPEEVSWHSNTDILVDINSLENILLSL
ncbi:MAG: glycosyltransferase family 61 protein [Janthinobacterium lividum]